MFSCGMAGRRVADWRFPSEKQARADETSRLMQAASAAPDPAPDQELPDNYWDALLSDSRARGRPALPIEQRRLSEILPYVLRVECDKCFRIIEIQTSDAVRLYGPHAIWKDAAMKLFEGSCTARTGNRDDDGCWPYFSKR